MQHPFYFYAIGSAIVTTATPLTAAANAITKIATNFFICFLSFLCD